MGTTWECLSMQRIFAIIILTFALAANALADLIDDNSKVPNDRLSELVKTVQGDYEAPALSNTGSISIDKYNSWGISCKKDVFDNSKYCVLFNDDLYISILNGRYSILVGTNHFPRSGSALKIDKNQTIYGYEGIFKNPVVIIEQLKKGSTAYTRFMKWPYEYNKDGEINLSDFNESFKEMKRRYDVL